MPHSCLSSTYCVAVGYSATTGEPLVLTGNPSGWGTDPGTVFALGKPFGSHGARYSVACTSTTSVLPSARTPRASRSNFQAIRLRGPLRTSRRSRSARDSASRFGHVYVRNRLRCSGLHRRPLPTAARTLRQPVVLAPEADHPGSVPGHHGRPLLGRMYLGHVLRGCRIFGLFHHQAACHGRKSGPIGPRRSRRSI